MTNNARNRANQKYAKKNYRRFIIDLNRKYDADLIRLLEKEENKREFFINLLKKHFTL